MGSSTARMVGAETIVTGHPAARRHHPGEAAGRGSGRSAGTCGRGRKPRARKTGALAASINSIGKETEKAILASVGTDVKRGSRYYGRFLEVGWTPQRRTRVARLTVPGSLNQYVGGIQKSGWKRNPRKAKDWNDYARKHGGRRIDQPIPFSSPPWRNCGAVYASGCWPRLRG